MLPDINLLPKYERQRPYAFGLFIVLFILLIGLFAYLTYSYFSTKGELDRVETEYALLNAEFDSYTTELRMLDETQVNSFEDVESFVNHYTIHTSLFIHDLVDRVPDHDYNYLKELIYTGDEISVRADFETLDRVAAYTTDLIASDYYDDIQANQVTTFIPIEVDESDRDHTDFEIIQRYEATYTLQLNKESIKGDQTNDE